MMHELPSRRNLLRGALAVGCGLCVEAALAVSCCPEISAPARLRRAGTAAAEAIDWQGLSKLRVVFGHQSVGFDVLRGIEHLARRDQARINIQQRREGPALAGINHFRIGRNGEPLSKMQDFSRALDAGAVDGADVAIMKLCYSDFESTTDAGQVAKDYIAHLESLARNYPATRFVAATTPLYVFQGGAKAWARGLIEKLQGRDSAPAKRAEFNARLRERYAAVGQLYDIARVESGSSGECCGGRSAEPPFESLRPELTYDGGHLNQDGQILLANALLAVLSANAAQGKGTSRL